MKLLHVFFLPISIPIATVMWLYKLMKFIQFVILYKLSVYFIVRGLYKLLTLSNVFGDNSKSRENRPPEMKTDCKIKYHGWKH